MKRPRGPRESSWKDKHSIKEISSGYAVEIQRKDTSLPGEAFKSFSTACW